MNDPQRLAEETLEHLGWKLFRGTQTAISEPAAKEIWEKKPFNVKKVWTNMAKIALQVIHEEMQP